MGDANIQRWGSVDTSQVLKQREEADKQKGSGLFWKPSEGRHKLRFLPPPMGESNIFYVSFQHFLRMPGMQKQRSFNCVLKMDPEGHRRCPGCEYSAQMSRSAHRNDQEEGDEARAKLRVFSNVIVRAEENKGPQIFAYGDTVHKKLIAMLEDPDVGGNFSDPIHGFDLILTRSGKGLDTEYDVLRCKDDSELGDLTWIDNMADLRKLVTVPNDKELAEICALKEWPPPAQRATGGAKVDTGEPAKPKVQPPNVTDAEYTDDGKK